MKAPCYTINRLLCLRKRERMIYYTGHLDHDLERSLRGSGRRYEGAPAPKAYYNLIQEIVRTTEELVAKRRIWLPAPVPVVRSRVEGEKVTVYQYIAEGR